MLKTLVWSSAFVRAVKRLIGQNPQFKSSLGHTLDKLAQDPFNPTLRTHKLNGELAGRWSCSVDRSNRILFKFTKDNDSGREEIFLLTMGSHDEVY